MTKGVIEWSDVRCTLAVTNACNLACKHCYIMAESQRSVDELSPSEYGTVAKEIMRLGGSDSEFFITGGEPLLRDDIMDILSIGYIVLFEIVTTTRRPASIDKV